MGLISELKRRNVLRMAALYLVSAWLIMQVAEVVIGLANLPNWIGPLILALLGVGLPIALVLSWFYELTPEGITLDEKVAEAAAIRAARGRRVDFVVIALLAAAVVLFAYDKWWPDGPLEQSIAVLAFENMSDDPEQDYLSDGIAEELLNALAKIPELRVTSRSSSFHFKNKNVPISELAEQLNVSHVLEGSVRKSGDRIRITAQLIDASSDKHLWSETYDRALDDLFVIQDEIAGQISNALRVRLVLASGEEVAPTVVKSAELTAYDAYLKGREIVRLRGDSRQMRAAGELFLKALRIDPTFAPAHAQIAIAVTLARPALNEDERDWAKEYALQHLDKAAALDPDLPELHGGRALFALFQDDNESAIVHAERALERNPDYVDAMNWLRAAYAGLGRHEEADEVLSRLQAVDPLSVVVLGLQGKQLAMSGQYAEAHEVADKLSGLSKRHGYFLHTHTSLFLQGNIAEGLYWALKVGEELGRDFAYSFAWQALLLVREYDEVRRLFDGAEPFIEAFIAAMEGNRDEVIRLSGGELEETPENPAAALDAGENRYWARRFEGALPLYKQFFDSGPEGRLPDVPRRGPEFEQVPVILLMRLAETQRRLGEEDAAQATADIARQENTKLRAAGMNNNNRDHAEAMIAAFDGDHDAAITALRAAIRNGMRVAMFEEPIFDDLRDDPGMAAVAEEFDAIMEQEHANVLQLICFENPTPNAWRPLPETCEDVTEQPGLLKFRR